MSAALTSGNRVRLIGTTARAKAPGRVGQGSSARRVRKVYGGLRRLGKAVYTARRRGPFVFGVRRGKVRYAAVVQNGLRSARARGLLGQSLRHAGFR